MLDKLVEQIKAEKELVVRSITLAKQTRDNAPSAMESHSDTTRSEHEKLAAALEEKLRGLNLATKTLSKTKLNESNITGLWSLVRLVSKDRIMEVLIVPNELGGRQLEGFITLSAQSPLGSVCMNKKPESEFEFNKTKWIIRN